MISNLPCNSTILQLNTIEALVCGNGLYLNVDTDTTCTPCPIGTWKSTTGNDLTDCKCNKGWHGADGSACSECEAGKYKENTGSASCSACPDSSTSPAESDDNTDCKCNVGYPGPAGGLCETCPVNKETNTDNTACYCKANYGGNLCTVCGIRQIKITAGDDSCTDCRDSSVQNLVKRVFVKLDTKPTGKCATNVLKGSFKTLSRARRNPSMRMIKVTVHEKRRVHEEQPAPASSPSRKS